MLRLLGTPRLEQDDTVVVLRVTRPIALLTLLACRADWVPRDVVAEMLWPQANTSDARTFVRVLVHRTRRLPWVGERLESAGDRVRLELPCDVPALRAAVRERDWRGAAELAQGTFLDGARLRDAPAFEAWAQSEREALEATALSALRARADEVHASGDATAAAALRERALTLDPYDETTLQGYLRAARDAGLGSAAAVVWARFRERLRDELHTEPLPATAALAASVLELAPGVPVAPSAEEAVEREGGVAGSESDVAAREGEAREAFAVESDDAASPRSVSPRPAPVARPLPAKGAPLVGRDEELAHLQHHVRGDVRALALVGLGGIGKSRLARELVWVEAPHYGDGACFVTLSEDADGRQLPAAIAAGLGLTLPETVSRRTALIDALRSRQLLIGVDGFEPHRAALGLLQALLEAAPEVRLVLTSRSPVPLAGVWRYDVRGLVVPDPGGEPDAIAQAPAVQLFCDAARRALPDLEPSVQDLRAAARVARAVDGMPLALELAAAWAPVLSFDQIADAVERGDDALLTEPASDDDDLGEASPRPQARSVRRVLEAAWARLRPRQRAALAACSVFRGAFHIEAAEVVAGAGPALLLGLVHASLLQRAGPGVLRVHDVIRRFVAERRTSSADERHAAYFLERLLAWGRALRSERQVAALAEVQAALPDLEGAWFNALRRQPASLRPEHVHALGSLALLHVDARRGRDWLEPLALALEAPGACLEALDAPVHARLAELRAACGEPDLAREASSRALQVATARGDHVSWVHARWQQALDAVAHGMFDEAVRAFDESAVRAEVAGMPHALAGLRMGRGNALYYRDGDLAASKAEIERAYALFERFGDTRGLAACAVNLGATLLARGEQAQSGRWFERAAEHARALDNQRILGVALGNLAGIAARAGDHGTAARLYDQSVAARRGAGDVTGEALARTQRAAVAVSTGAFDVALLDVDAAVRALSAIDDRGTLAIALAQRARVLAALARHGEAHVSLLAALDLVAERASLEDTLVVLYGAALTYAAAGRRDVALMVATAVAAAEVAGHHLRASAAALAHELGERSNGRLDVGAGSDPRALAAALLADMRSAAPVPTAPPDGA